MAIDRVEHALDLAGGQIDPLDPTAIIIIRAIAGDEKPVHFGVDEAAIVADPKRTIRPDGQPVRAAPGVRDDLCLAVSPAAGDAFLLDFNDDDAAICHDNRTFRKAQAGGDDLEFHWLFPPRHFFGRRLGV